MTGTTLFTDTATRTWTRTATATATRTATSTRTFTETRTATRTRTDSPTSTSTHTETHTQTDTLTSTDSPTETATSTRTASHTRTSTETPTVTPFVVAEPPLLELPGGITWISFGALVSGDASVRIYNSAGELVHTLWRETLLAGRTYQVPWTGLNDRGATVASNVYVVRFHAPKVRLMTKLAVSR